MFLLFILQQYQLNESYVFFQAVLPTNMSRTKAGATGAVVSKVTASVILRLLTVGN
jgi:hypothetical protein